MQKQPHEEIEQTYLFQWAYFMENRYPELRLMFHVPNGGKRNLSEAKRLKAAGVKSGVPDLFLPVARGKWFGLFIEMKYGKNTTTKNQKEWIADLTEQGYRVEVCYGWEQASKIIEEYLRYPKHIQEV